jgi:hypothetical protein
MTKLERAHQRHGQDSREFHAYLDTLEQHFPRAAEKERALFFFAKLLPELGQYIHEYTLNLPETRDEMVTLATHYWGLMKRNQKQKDQDNLTYLS